MNLPSILPVFVGAAISGVITWLVSRHYYKKAGDELKQQATRLECLNKLILHGLENADVVELVRDASGKPTGITIKGGSVLVGEGRMSPRGEVIERRPANRNAQGASDIDSPRNSD